MEYFVEDCYVKPATHKIVVRNLIVTGNSYDTRSFHIITTKNINFIISKLSQLMNNHSKEVHSMIQFIEDKKSTHQILIEDRKLKKFKCFNIKLSSYSSKEVADIMFSYLCHGRENQWKKKKLV